MATAVARPHRPKAERLMDAKRALDMRLAGTDDIDICRQLGISRATLFRWIRWALDQQIDPTVEQYREEAAGRIRESRRRIYATLNATRQDVDVLSGKVIAVPVPTPAEVAALVGRLAQLEDLEAKLRGGYAPTRVDVTHRVQDAFDQLLQELNSTTPATTPTPQEA